MGMTVMEQHHKTPTLEREPVSDYRVRSLRRYIKKFFRILLRTSRISYIDLSSKKDLTL